MRKLFALSVLFLSIISCSTDEKSCNCEQIKYERDVRRSTAIHQNYTYIGEWRVTSEKTKTNDDCGSNGIESKIVEGRFNPWGDNEQHAQEWKYVTVCK